MATVRLVDDAVFADGDSVVTEYIVSSVNESENTIIPDPSFGVLLKKGMVFVPFFHTNINHLMFIEKTKGCLPLALEGSTFSYASARVERVERTRYSSLLITTQNAVFLAICEPVKLPSLWKRFQLTLQYLLLKLKS